MAAKSKKTIPLAAQRKAPANRHLTKENVATAMTTLRKQGVEITTKTLFAAVGSRGSFSTLTKLRKQIEDERPDLIQPTGISRLEAIEFIQKCDRSDLSALEDALGKRRRVIRLRQNFLVLEMHESRELTDVMEDLGAVKRIGLGWTLEPTRWNYEAALYRHGFRDNVEDATRAELTRLAPNQ